MDPLTLSFLMSAGIPAVGAGLDYLAGAFDDPEVSKVKFPEVDFGARQRGMMSQVGEQTTRQGRSAGAQLASMGLEGGSKALGVAGKIGAQGARNQMAGLAEIERMRDEYERALANFQMGKAQLIDEAKAAQPSPSDYLTQGASLFPEFHRSFDPERFRPVFNMGGGG